jgi:serine protease Do
VYSDGFILTKASEVFLTRTNEPRGVISVRLSDGSEYEAKVYATHIPTDLAMLKIDLKNLKAITFADSEKIPIGHWLAAAGPASDAVAVGILSATTRKLTSYPENIIENSNRGFIGIIPVDAKDDDGKVIGAKIDSLSPKGAARKAGLKAGDVIIEINGKPSMGQESLRAQLEGLQPGDSVKLKIKRDGEEKDFKVTLTGSPEPNRSDIQNAMGGELSGRRTGFPAVIQTDMVVSPKDCGGPVVDLEGRVLGMNIARAGRVETWILPSEQIRPLLTDLKAGKSTAAPKK